MNPTMKHVFFTIKTLVIIVLLIVVFNFFFDRANQSSEEEVVEEMLADMEQQVKKVTTSKETFEYPIQRRAAAEYTVVEKTAENAYGDPYLFVCAVSAAVGQVQRAQTIVNIGLDHQDELKGEVDKMEIFLAPEASLCQESRVIGTGYYLPSGAGWEGVSAGQWTWLVRTSNAKVTSAQVAATKLYEDSKEAFKDEFGDLDYSDHLDVYVAEQLGKKPKYVTAGMWNDDFVKQ